MENKQAQTMTFVSEETQNSEIPAWKALDNVVRQWVALSGFEKDQANYAKLKEYYA